MTLWARLTWQAADPGTFAADLAMRLGVTARPGRLTPLGSLLDLGGVMLEVRPWAREGPSDHPTPSGRLVLEPVPGGEDPPPDVEGVPGPGRLRLVGVAWATVDIERAESDLDMWLGPAPDGGGDGATDPHLGARARVRGGGSLPGEWMVLVEPVTEGRAAASLARDGEGPCGLYLRPADGLNAWLAYAAAAGIPLRPGPPEPGPFGLQVALAGAPPSGPHLLVVSDRTPVSRAAGAGTIAP